MKTRLRHFTFRKIHWTAAFCLSVLLCCCPRVTALQTNVWTNTLGGSWHNALNWSPNVVPGVFGDNVYITNSGTYAVIITNTINHIDAGTIGGSSGTQTLRVQDGVTFNGGFWNVQSNGVTIFTNSAFTGIFFIRTNGQVVFTGAGQKTLTGVALYNFGGTITWNGGLLYFLNGATINNAGLWQIATDNPIQFSGTPTVWTNSGVLRKISGAGETRIGIVTFVNTASGLVDAQSGTLVLYGSTTNLLGGTFNTAAGATTTFTEGTWFDSGATCTGAGLNQFYGTTLHLRTNTIAGLKLIANNVALGTNFQQAGAITNLTLDGATLLGTNRVGNSGVLTLNSGSPGSQLTVQPGGELLLASTATKSLINLKLINQGTVNWTAGTIVLGAFGTVVSNGGLWQIQSDDELYDGGSQTSWFTNAGTLRKIAWGAGMTRIEGIKFFNMPGAFVQVDAGTLRLPFNYTNSAGTLRLNGGILAAGSGGFFGLGPFTLSGGTLDGSGTLPINNLILGGVVSPGSGAPGLLQFSAGLTFGAGGSGNMLKLDGTGTTPGSGYDQLVVTGSVVISNCLLNISGLPNVTAGTTFTIIQNDGVDPVQGTFIGWPENSLIPVGSQNFRIHYAGGTGNDVTLVKDSDAGPLFSIGSYSNGTFFISSTGSNSVVYTIQATTNFLQWTNLASATGNVSGKFNFTDTNAYLFRYRFYRTMN